MCASEYSDIAEDLPVGKLLLINRVRTPRLIIRYDRLQSNIRLFASYCNAHGASHAPHSKTAMSREVASMQLEAGAWALTAASVAQAKIIRSWGVERIMIANQVIDLDDLRWIARENKSDAGGWVAFFVDSPRHLMLAAEAAAATGGFLRVLVERGHIEGRCGVRSTESGRDLVAEILRTPGLQLAGVAAFEGLVGFTRTPDAIRRAAQVMDDAATLMTAAESMVGAGHELVLTAGGSMYFDVMVDRFRASGLGERGVRLLLRSGCYAFHDHGLFRGVSPLCSTLVSTGGLEPAIELWVRILSRPEAGRLIVNAGRRNFGTDAGVPVVLDDNGAVGSFTPRPDWTVVSVNDHHTHVRVPHQAVADVGELLRLGISHPCTTLDKWRAAVVVDASYAVQGAFSLEL
jgi:D-serine deaminase-like pyridoxal phosphate-dependent protein